MVFQALDDDLEAGQGVGALECALPEGGGGGEKVEGGEGEGLCSAHGDVVGEVVGGPVETLAGGGALRGQLEAGFPGQNLGGLVEDEEAVVAGEVFEGRDEVLALGVGHALGGAVGLVADGRLSEAHADADDLLYGAPGDALLDAEAGEQVGVGGAVVDVGAGADPEGRGAAEGGDAEAGGGLNLDEDADVEAAPMADARERAVRGERAAVLSVDDVRKVLVVVDDALLEQRQEARLEQVQALRLAGQEHLGDVERQQADVGCDSRVPPIPPVERSVAPRLHAVARRLTPASLLRVAVQHELRVAPALAGLHAQPPRRTSPCTIAPHARRATAHARRGGERRTRERGDGYERGHPRGQRWSGVKWEFHSLSANGEWMKK